MILISRTYSTVTPESAENGEAADSGMLSEDVAYTFRELVDLIEREGFTDASRQPATGSTFEWLQSAPQCDYSDGSETTEAIHYSRDNKPASARYWRLAFIAAGIVKQRK